MVVAEEDVIVMGVDNSGWMLTVDRYSLRLQYDAMRLYAQAKIKSNPKTAIGIETMGATADFCLEPTSDLDIILDHIDRLSHRSVGGHLEFWDGIFSCVDSIRDFKPSQPKNKRMLVFTRGPVKIGIGLADNLGKSAKRHGIAVDVVNFCLAKRYDYTKTALEAFVAAAGNNSNIQHIDAGPHTRVREVLSKLISMEEWEFISMEEGEIAARINKAKDPRGKNQALHVLDMIKYGDWNLNF